MKTMTLTILTGALLLSGCSLKQITPQDEEKYVQGGGSQPHLIKQLKLNMSKEQVISQLGEPTQTNTNNNNQWAYLQQINAKQKGTLIKLEFTRNQLSKITLIDEKGKLMSQQSARGTQKIKKPKAKTPHKVPATT